MLCVCAGSPRISLDGDIGIFERYSPGEARTLPQISFFLRLAYERYMHIEFVPGNYESNPSFKYFVLVI